MKTEAEIRLRVAQLRAAADSLEWVLLGNGDVGKLAEPMPRSLATERPPANGLTEAEQDVASALFNLGIGSRVKSEEAAKAASAQGPAEDFEVLFKRALTIARPRRTA